MTLILVGLGLYGFHLYWKHRLQTKDTQPSSSYEHADNRVDQAQCDAYALGRQALPGIVDYDRYVSGDYR